MNEPIDNAVALIGSTNALRDWFISQEVAPADCMLVMEYFMALMIVQNCKGPKDEEEKYALINSSIRSLVTRIRISK